MEKTLAAEKPLQVVEAETASSAHDEPLCGPVEPVADRPTRAEAEEAVRTLIKWAGDDPDREGLLDTPGRVVRSYEEFYDGYEADPKAILARTFEETDGYDEIVLLRSIRFESHCEHHMAPIIGRVHVAYLPRRRIVGMIPRSRESSRNSPVTGLSGELTSTRTRTVLPLSRTSSSVRNDVIEFAEPRTAFSPSGVIGDTG